jgi:hypothetical protein
MPTIELTDEQAEELRGVVDDEIDYIRDVYECDPSAEAIQEMHRISVLSDILELLEIA